MLARVTTVAFQGVEAIPVDVQIQLSTGLVSFTIVGLPDKAVAESRERVRAALHASGLALPAKRITVNLAPADLPKEGSHYDLPIALGLMVVLGAIPSDALDSHVILGELGLDGRLAPVAGVLPAAMAAQARGDGIICPEKNGGEAVWAGEELSVLAPHSLIALANHFKGTQVLSPPSARCAAPPETLLDLKDVRGQESARRALEIIAAGGHNLLMVGVPGSGKSMLARRLPSLLPPLTPQELLEVALVSSVAGRAGEGMLSCARPFRAPHHSASMAAMVGGGGGGYVRPGEASLAHNGVLFLDELPEFAPQVLDSLRQPLEEGQAVIARANCRVTYPARFQLVAAMNPCRCGYAGSPGHQCRLGVRCASSYQARLSGPFLDRIDMCIEVPSVRAQDLIAPAAGESSQDVAERVQAARQRQTVRYKALGVPIRMNAHAPPALIEQIVELNTEGRTLLQEAIESLKLSARGFHRVLKLARSLADLDGSAEVHRFHLAEALSTRALPSFPSPISQAL